MQGQFQADYYIALSRLQLMKKEYKAALESLTEATALDLEVKKILLSF